MTGEMLVDDLVTNLPNAEVSLLGIATLTDTTDLAAAILESVATPEAALKVEPPGYVADRRRPGRMVSVNSALVPLLRATEPALLAGATVATDHMLEAWADCAPARGLITGIAISLVAWAVGIGLFVAL